VLLFFVVRTLEPFRVEVEELRAELRVSPLRRTIRPFGSGRDDNSIPIGKPL
jgi:hypothetical protein